MLASVVAAQTPAVAEVLSGFDNHRLPALLQQLHTHQHESAVKELAKLGDSAHRYLLGKLRFSDTVRKNFSGAFGGFGPHSAWAMPALLEQASGTYLLPTQWDLLVKLGPTAKPALPLLAKLRHKPGQFRQIQNLTGAAPTARALPSATVDARWRAPLLAVLEDADKHEHWWPAVQALLTIDDEASVAACSVLLGYISSEHPTRRQQASNLLHAIQCHFASLALSDLETSSQLPASLRYQQMLRTILACSHQLAKPHQRNANRTTPHIPVSLTSSDDATDQRICALSAALHAATHPDIAQDPMLLERLTQSSDPQTARFARLASSSASERDNAWIQAPFAKIDHRTLSTIKELAPDVAARMPLARLREVLAVCPEPQPAQPSASTPDDIAAQILRSAKVDKNRLTKLTQNRLGVAIVAAIANRAPDLILEQELTQAERQQIAHALIRSHGPTEPMRDALHEFVIANVALEKPKKSYTIEHTLPESMAPTVIARLKNKTLVEHTLRFLQAHRRLLYWAQAIDKQAADVAAAAPLVAPAEYKAFAELFRYGKACRRQAERLILDESLPEALRVQLAKGGANVKFPASAAFVLQALASEQDFLRNHGVAQASSVTTRKAEVSAALRAIYPTGDERIDPFTIGQVGLLMQPDDVTWLSELLPKTSGMTRLTACLALLGFAGDQSVAKQQIAADLKAADSNLAQRIWSRLSFSEAGSAAFLEQAVEQLGKQDDWQSAFRLCRLLEAATVRRPKEANAALQSLRGCGKSHFEQQAAQVLRQLEQKAARRKRD